MTLTWIQREGIRSLADDDQGAVSTSTIEALAHRGLIDRRSGKWELTTKGRRAHRQIMASGDGPEALKDKFKF